ncbi:MAG: hypothetical protein FJ087_16270 [Deltaproteobacteria bacterium]|nr:hypothetical protein [Deltaproteobacteria bacterium]
MEKPYFLGEDVEIWCRYCRLNLYAAVSSLTDDRQPAKVQCRTCRHFQDYKPPIPDEVRREKLIAKAMKLAGRRTGGGVPKAEKKPAAPAGGALSPEAVARRMWDEATKDAHPLKTKVYDPHRRYGERDLIADKANGLGVVNAVHDEDDTISVLFRDGFKSLPHNRPREDE